MKDTPEQERVGLAKLRLLAQLVPCQMCRIKDMGGTSYNIEPGGGCRHSEGMPIDEVVKRLAYAVSQSDNARELADAIRVKDVPRSVEYEVGVQAVLDAFDETEKGE